MAPDLDIDALENYEKDKWCVNGKDLGLTIEPFIDGYQDIFYELIPDADLYHFFNWNGYAVAEADQCPGDIFSYFGTFIVDGVEQTLLTQVIDDRE